MGVKQKIRSRGRAWRRPKDGKDAIKLILPKLYPKQAAFVNAKKKISITFASTKAGKTVGLGVWILSYVWQHGSPNKDGYWFAPTTGVARIAMRRICEWLLKADPDHAIWQQNKSEMFILLRNGGRIFFRGAENPDGLYGPDAICAVIDEGTRCKAGIFDVVVSVTTATDGPIRIIGNMRSRGAWMYQKWLAGINGDPDIESFKVDARDAVEAGIIKQSTLDRARMQLSEDAFKSLYLCEPTEDGANPFGYDAIARCGGEGSIYEPRAIGVDLAKAIDYTVVLGLDEEGVCALFERWRRPWNVTLPRLIEVIGKKKAMVDSTGVGDPIVEQLQAKLPNVEGFKFTASSKQALMEGLAVAIQQGDVHGLPDVVLEELRIFEAVSTRTGVRYAAPEGMDMHDDCVMALAMAVSRLGRAKKRRQKAVSPKASPYPGPVADELAQVEYVS